MITYILAGVYISTKNRNYSVMDLEMTKLFRNKISIFYWSLNKRQTFFSSHGWMCTQAPESEEFYVNFYCNLKNSSDSYDIFGRFISNPTMWGVSLGMLKFNLSASPLRKSYKMRNKLLAHISFLISAKSLLDKKPIESSPFCCF